MGIFGMYGAGVIFALTLLMLSRPGFAGPFTVAACYSVCGTGWAACYAAAGLVAG